MLRKELRARVAKLEKSTRDHRLGAVRAEFGVRASQRRPRAHHVIDDGESSSANAGAIRERKNVACLVKPARFRGQHALGETELDRERVRDEFPEMPASTRFPARRVNNRPEMNQPAQQKKPEDGREAELKDCHDQSALHQLAESRDEEAADCRNHIARRTL